jgi:transposase
MPSITELLCFPVGFTVLTVSATPSRVLVTLASQATTAQCPRCQTPSTSRHSSYTRTLRDLACGGRSVCLLVQTHKWRCRVSTCSQGIFAERLDPLARRSARLTIRLMETFSLLTLATSGQGAARLGVSLGMKAAPSTLLRQMQALPIPEPPAPVEIGLDEFSFRRGARFGTIIVDLQRHQVIDLLPDREAATVVRWLRAHPTIRVVSRDRSGTYAQAISEALPMAQQVLDRFHLLRNVRDVLERFLLTKRLLLRDVTRSTDPAACPVLVTEAAVQQQRVERWVQVYQEIHALAAKGVDITTIARRLQVSRPVVYRYLQMTTPPTPKQPRPNPLDPLHSPALE